MSKISAIVERMNECGRCGTPFLFVINFEMDECIFHVNPEMCDDLFFQVGDHTNCCESGASVNIVPCPIEANEYRRKFEDVHKALRRGDTFLVNLTVATPIETNATLADIYRCSSARYKLLVLSRFVSFSPEAFVKIENGKIYSYPMKGTIDASIPCAEELILSNKKEICEHNTIVDLIRNDLSQVAHNVIVKRFRYVERVGSVLQVSSEIVGQLKPYYLDNLGDTIMKLLPAGSISGAPKESTIRVIKMAEGERRGFYTGVMAYFDGKTLDSGVLIRYVEQREDGLYFRSGGGVTAQSSCEDEYDEVLKKIFIPMR